jgi:hypothetical protein
MPGDIRVRVKWSIPGGPEHTGTMIIRPKGNHVWFVSDNGKSRTLVSREMLRQATVSSEDHDHFLQDWIDKGFRPLTYQGQLLTYDEVRKTDG